ncbi:MAG: hypothetical protein LBJ65_32255 [Burkholderia sp.]|jgi:hypothetical protein|uniref:hypothetical protein n=1 Tax=Burkholderia sp. TaxID=36773 RepID=UPI00282A1A24|nr:hypothetical protein [Burkholderia sp.]MDR0246291.1 hypothetical protein [Burkholderia sp.]
MNDLTQSSEPELIVRGSRFALPTLVFALIVIGGGFIWAASSNPFFSFTSFIMPFVGALGGLAYLFVMTRAVFLDDGFKVQRISVPYRDVVEVTRGPFSLVVLYRVATRSGAGKVRKVKLPFAEMRIDDRKKCLEILRRHAPEAFKSDIAA